METTDHRQSFIFNEDERLILKGALTHYVGQLMNRRKPDAETATSAKDLLRKLDGLPPADNLNGGAGDIETDDFGGQIGGQVGFADFPGNSLG